MTTREIDTINFISEISFGTANINRKKVAIFSSTLNGFVMVLSSTTLGAREPSQAFDNGLLHNFLWHWIVFLTLWDYEVFENNCILFPISEVFCLFLVSSASNAKETPLALKISFLYNCRWQ